MTPGQGPAEQGDSRTPGTTAVEWARDTLIAGRGCPRHTAFDPGAVSFGGSLVRGHSGSEGDPENFLSCSLDLSDQALLCAAIPPRCRVVAQAARLSLCPGRWLGGGQGAEGAPGYNHLSGGKAHSLRTLPSQPRPAMASHGPALCRAGALSGQTRVPATVLETRKGRKWDGERKERGPGVRTRLQWSCAVRHTGWARNAQRAVGRVWGAPPVWENRRKGLELF